MSEEKKQGIFIPMLFACLVTAVLVGFFIDKTKREKIPFTQLKNIEASASNAKMTLLQPYYYYIDGELHYLYHMKVAAFKDPDNKTVPLEYLLFETHYGMTSIPIQETDMIKDRFSVEILSTLNTEHNVPDGIESINKKFTLFIVKDKSLKGFYTFIQGNYDKVTMIEDLAPLSVLEDK